MGYITIDRPLEVYNDKLSYAIIVNGKKHGELKIGERQWVNIPASSKQWFEVRLLWFRSKKIQLNQVSENSIITVSGHHVLNIKTLILSFLTISLFLISDFVFHYMNYTLAIVIFCIFFASILSSMFLLRRNWVQLDLNGLQ